jgi:hypothetical protein
VSDSAGVPWQGRHFEPNQAADDDGSPDPRLIEAIRRFRAADASVADVVRAAHDARLLVPLVSALGDEGVGPHGLAVDKTQELSLVTVAAPDGRTVLPAFTSVAALGLWNPDARPIPVAAARVALAAAAEQTPLVVLDPGSETEFVIRRPALRALATGESWVPSFDDAAVLEAFLECADGEPVRAVQLAPGDPDARLVAPELVVQLAIEGDADAVVQRLAARWSEHPVIVERVDSIAVRVERL